MKIKLKLLVLPILALSLIACSSSSGGGSSGPSGGGSSGGGKPSIIPDDGTTSKEPIILEGWQRIDVEIKSKVEEAQKEAERIPSSIPYYIDSNKYFIIPDNDIEDYDEKQIQTDVPDPTKTTLYLNPDSHLEFKGNVGEIKFKHIRNYGNMYFVDNLDNSKEYVLSICEEIGPYGEVDFFQNSGNIYVMDRNHGSTLKIDGIYFSDNGNIHLGLYVSKDRTNFSTDKVHITRYAEGETKVHFIYNNTQAKGLLENAKYHGEDYVIKVDEDIESVSNAKDAFKMEDSIPLGTKVFKWNYYEKEGETGSHLWKLENKE